jgi:hypothetical protein
MLVAWARLMSRGANNELDPYPFVKLAQSGLPPRVRGLLEGVYQAAQPIIDAALTRALDELDRDLFAHGERSSSPGEQNHCLASLRELRLRRAEFMLACRTGVQRSLLALIDPSVRDETLGIITARDDLARPGAADIAAREENLTLSQIATRAEIRVASELQALAYRFGVIAGSPPIEIESLALGPYKLCAAIRSAGARFKVIPAHRLALYRRIDKALFADPRGLYGAIRQYLIQHRVLANLQLSPSSEPTPDAAAASRSSPVAAAAVHGAAAHDDSPQPDSPAVASTGQPAATERALETTAEVIVPAARQELPAIAPLTPEPARAWPLPAEEVPLDDRFFRTLRACLVTVRRDRQGAAAGSDSARTGVDRRQLQAALGVLQLQSPGPVMLAGKWVNRTVAQIKQDLVNQLRNLGDGGTPRLQDEDAQTIDLIGLLFDQLLAAYRPNSLSHAVVSRLQIPLLKVALRDPGFFTRPTHQARRFLNAVVECLTDWVDDEDADRHVVEKLQMVIDRLVREFDDDTASFERCLGDLDQYVAGMRRKAEVAERRQVEAAKGREKLDLARAAAQEVVQQQVSGSAAPEAILTLLQTAWADAVALSLLRQGVDHPGTGERIMLIQQLLDVFVPGKSNAARNAALGQLRNVLEEGLAAVGFHDDAVTAAWNDICALAEARAEHDLRAATLAIGDLIRHKPRLGGDGAGATSGSNSLLIDLGDQALDPAERAMAERIRQLPPGTCFEFTRSRSGGTGRCRLSWYSAVTGRCMLLNARGGKCEERTIGQLARELLSGSVRVAANMREPPVDRAWRAIRLATPAAQSPGLPA